VLDECIYFILVRLQCERCCEEQEVNSFVTCSQRWMTDQSIRLHVSKMENL